MFTNNWKYFKKALYNFTLSGYSDDANNPQNKYIVQAGIKATSGSTDNYIYPLINGKPYNSNNCVMKWFLNLSNWSVVLSSNTDEEDATIYNTKDSLGNYISSFAVSKNATIDDNGNNNIIFTMTGVATSDITINKVYILLAVSTYNQPFSAANFDAKNYVIFEQKLATPVSVSSGNSFEIVTKIVESYT